MLSLVRLLRHLYEDNDPHLIMQILDIFNLKINVIPNGFEKHMNFTISNKLNFIDTFQFLSFLLYSSVKNLSKDVLSIAVKKNVTITY